MNKPLTACAVAALTFSSIGAHSATIETATPNDILDQRADAYAFTNATIQLNPSERLTDATLLIKDGKIVDVRAGAKAPRGYAEVKLDGRFIYPGFIELDSDYGLPKPEERAPFSFSSPEVIESPTDGAYNANQAIRSEYQAGAQFSADQKAAKKLRALGFGAALTHRHDGIARGAGALVSLGDQSDNNLVIASKAATLYSLDKGSSTQSYPISIMGAMALLRQTYLDADWYAKQDPKPFTDQSLDAWIANQSLPQIFDAGKDWLTVLRADKVGDEFDVQYVMRSAGDSYQRIDAIKASGAALIVPLNFPETPKVSDPFAAEQVTLADLKHWELAPTNPAALASADIQFALTAAGDKSFWKNLRKAIEQGLSERDALAALTTIPAKLIKQPQLGSLKPGNMANFLITSGELFDKDTVLEENWIAGHRYKLAEHAVDHSGRYALTVGQQQWPLEISGKPNKPKAKITLDEPQSEGQAADDGDETIASSNFETPNETSDEAGGKASSPKVKLSIVGDRIALSFAPEKDAAKIRLSGWIGQDQWQGRGQLGDGRWIDWSAKRTGNLTDENTDDAKTSENEDSGKEEDQRVAELGSVIYPFSAFGREQVAEAQTLLFRNATVWTNEDDGILEDTDVLVRDGKIARVGKNLPSAGARVVDAKGMHLTSGIIDEHSHIALNAVNDVAANSGMVRMGDVINSEDVNIYRNLAGGVTAGQLLHGSANPIGGQSALIKYRWGVNPEQMKIADVDGFIKFALGENVKRSANSASVRYPQTRMGVEQIYRDAFSRARDYEKAQRGSDKPRRDLALDAMVEILNQQRFISCHSYVQSEINMLMHVAEDFGFKVNTFTHILEGYKVADKMAEHGAGGSTFADWWAYKWEVRYAIPYNPALMTQAGVTVAINSDSAEMSRRLNQEAAKSVKYGGMSEADAWKMVTLNPAKLLHLDDRMGSIKAGKDADLVLWTENPLSIYAVADMTLVDGVVYFSRESDQQARAEVLSERARLIAKALKDKSPSNSHGKNKGKNGGIARPAQQWQCDSLHGFEYLTAAQAHFGEYRND